MPAPAPRSAPYPGGAVLVPLPEVANERGDLLPVDFAGLPFPPRRIFVVRRVPPGLTRGGHAHRLCHQLFVRLSGEVRIDIRSGNVSDAILLADSNAGLLIPAGVWSSQTYLSPDASLLVLCSESYDPADYLP